MFKWLSFQEARVFVRKLGLKNQEQWREYCKSGNKPNNIPKTPMKVYPKYVSMGDWIGTGFVANQNRDFLSFEEARAFMHKLGLKSQKEWREYAKSDKRPDNIPSSPDSNYVEYVSMDDWLGTGRSKKTFLPFEEARAFVRKLGLKSQKEWKEYCKSGKKPDNIPSNPHRYTEFISLGDWLGTGTIAPQWRDFLSFEEARAFVRKLGLKSQKEWKEYCKSGKKPDNIPSQPHQVYGKEFISLGDWLGTGTIANGKRDFLPFEEARAFVRKLGLKLQKEWKEYCKSGKKPDNIPINPWNAYKEEYTSVSDWLGSNFIAPRLRKFLSFRKARAFVRKLKLKNGTKWKEYCKSGKKPNDIPSQPHQVYGKEYVSMDDWLGTGRSKKTFLPFEEARAFVHNLGLKNHLEWVKYCKSGKKPDNIPSSPDTKYADNFDSWGDWLNSGNKSPGRFLPFEEARAFVRKLVLKSQKEWKEYCKSGKKPDNIPNAPYEVYDQFKSTFDWLIGPVVDFLPFEEARAFVRKLGLKNDQEWRQYCKSEKKSPNIPSQPHRRYKTEFISLGDWLGTGTIANGKKEFLPFEEARAFVHNLGLKNKDEWSDYCKSGNKPNNIPNAPICYDKFISWGDWLGTGTISTREIRQTRIQKYKEIVESLASCLPSLPTTAWWYILIQSGLDATAKEVKLLKKYQKGKLNLNELVDALISPDEIDEELDALEAYGKSKTDFIAKANEVLNHPLIAGLDEEAIAAIVAELQATIWDQIFRASMTGDISEKEEIFKLKEILKRTHT